jgi:hypothetical protein
MERFLTGEQARELEIIGDLYDTLFYELFNFKLCQVNEEDNTVFGWIELPYDTPEKHYVQSLPRLVKILSETYKDHYPKGLFTLDNNIGDKAFSFKIYLGET